MIFSSDLKALGRPVVVATHMRSGTHLCLDFLRRQFAVFDGWKFPMEANDSLYLPLDVFSGDEATWGEARALRVIRRAKRLLVKAHWTLPDLSNLANRQPEMTAWLDENADFIHVVRNPLKVMASMYAWNGMNGRVDEPWLRKNLAEWVAHTKAWQNRRGTLLIRSEDILSRPLESVERLGKFLGECPRRREPLLPAQSSSIWHSRWNRMFTSRPASTAILVKNPVIAPGELFDSRALRVFEEVSGELMADLGYNASGA